MGKDTAKGFGIAEEAQADEPKKKKLKVKKRGPIMRTIRKIELDSGGTLALTGAHDTYALSEFDRDFVFRMIGHFDDYGKAKDLAQEKGERIEEQPSHLATLGDPESNAGEGDDHAS